MTYRWTFPDRDNGGKLYKRLLRVRKPYRKHYGNKDSRGNIQNRIGIGEPAKIVEKMTTPGGWKDDTVHGKNGFVAQQS